MPERQHRADRILDAAADLVLRLGYRKVTMEDVANRAEIGKGTVYLHWRAKKTLFRAVITREACGLLEDFVTAIREDHGEVRPHRFLRMYFLRSQHQPLLHAMFTGDMELLGALTDKRLTSGDMLAADEFYDVMFRHQLLRADVPNIAYSLQATGLGFFLCESVNTKVPEPGVEAKADLLAHTIRHACEPAQDPPEQQIAAAASEICHLFENLISTHRKWIYEHDPEQPG